ncbi:cytochrome P450 [Marasmius fiardii PR-910]|nr:cytochrome P450 [Marasmius fiardii PR-910]
MRSHNYSDRPDMPMTIDLMRWDWNIGLMRYNDWWRLHRRTFHQSFQPRAPPEYYDLQTERTKSLMQKLMTSPQDFFQHIRDHSGGIVLEIIYGYQLQDKNDLYIKLADDAWVGLKEAGNHGSFLVDYMPILKHVPSWFPGGSFKRKAEVWGNFTDQLEDCPWTFLKQSIEEGTAVPCFSTRNLEKFKILSASGEGSFMEEVIKNCAAVSLTAGADTTVSAVLSFILAMVVYPEVQARAQRELEEVIGSRLPEFNDRGNLPYIDAILSETLRWNPVTPLAVPHRSVNDDVYEGLLIPGGSTVVANAWAVVHDESLYGPETIDFNPDRFLPKEGQKLPPNPEPIAFGFGRRICPGRHLAVNSIWLAMIYLLTSFTMAKELDQDGNEVEPVIEYSDGLSSHPRRFQCRFIPRSLVTSARL